MERQNAQQAICGSHGALHPRPEARFSGHTRIREPRKLQRRQQVYTLLSYSPISLFHLVASAFNSF